MARLIRSRIAALAWVAAAGPLLAASPLDVNAYSVVYRVPGMNKVRVASIKSYATGPRGSLRADVYLPADGQSVPAVVFVNGVGGALNDWEIYRSWGRLVAAHGLAGVTFEAPMESPSKALPQVMAWLEHEGPGLGIDPSRVAIWSCSGNVTAAMPYQMGDAPKSVRAAVVYYGTGEARAIRKDLPVYYVLAGRDSVDLNKGIRALWSRAIAEAAPWTMVSAPGLTHAFDALDEGAESRRVVRETVEFLVAKLQPPPQDLPPSLERQALTHFFGQEPAEAATNLRQIVAANPKDFEAQGLLGLVLMRSGKGSEAVEVLKRSIAAGNDDPDVYRVLGSALLQEKRYDESIAAFERVLEKRHPWPWLNYQMARAYALSGKKEPALDLLGKAVEMGYRDRERLLSDEDLASLRGEPRFKEIVASIP